MLNLKNTRKNIILEYNRKVRKKVKLLFLIFRIKKTNY